MLQRTECFKWLLSPGHTSECLAPPSSCWEHRGFFFNLYNKKGTSRDITHEGVGETPCYFFNSQASLHSVSSSAPIKVSVLLTFPGFNGVCYHEIVVLCICYLSSFGSIGLSCDLKSLMDVRRVIDFQLVQPFFLLWI